MQFWGKEESDVGTCFDCEHGRHDLDSGSVCERCCEYRVLTGIPYKEWTPLRQHPFEDAFLRFANKILKRVFKEEVEEID